MSANFKVRNPLNSGLQEKSDRNRTCTLSISFIYNFCLSVNNRLMEMVTVGLCSYIISERELKFMFAICCRPSVCRLSVCHLSVCNVRVPYSGD